MTGRIDALLFDLGGVLIDVDFDRVFARWAAHARCEASAIRSRWAPDVSYQQHERGEIDARAYFACLRGTLDVALTDEQFADGWNAIFGGEVPGMARLLREAATRLPLYVFSNSNRAHQVVWSRLYEDLLAPFRRVFVSSDLGLRKPDPAAFHAVAAAIGAPPARILFFDDALENVEGAMASGMHAIHVRSREDVERALRPLLA